MLFRERGEDGILGNSKLCAGTVPCTSDVQLGIGGNLTGEFVFQESIRCTVQ